MILHYFKLRRWEVLSATLLCVFSAILSTAVLAQFNRLAQLGLGPGLGRVLLVTMGLIAATFVTNLAAQVLLARFGSATIADLRRDLAARFLQLDYQRLLDVGKHQVTGALIADLSRVATLFLVLPLFLFNALMIGFCLVYLALLDPALCAVFVGFMSFAVGSSLKLMAQGGPIYEQNRREEDQLFEHFRGIAEGKKELTLNAARAHHFFHCVLAEAIETNRKTGYTTQKWWGVGGAWSAAMIFCAVFSVIWSGHAYFGSTPATIMQFVIVALFIMNPLNYLIVASRDLAIGAASIKQLGAIGIEPAALTAQVAAPAASAFNDWKTISLNGLTHRHQDDDRHGFNVGPIELTLQRGETLFLVGGNGSGKSTLALLLSGLLQPQGGHIEVDQQRLDAAALPSYRRLFTGVFSDFYLFNHVVDRNGRLAPDASVNACLEKLDLHRKVQAAGGQLSTLELSQGQRKRLALAQSYIDDSDIYLFDEWAADQDPVFRHYFYVELLPELRRRGKTVVAITHDERYFGGADRVVKLDQGQIAEIVHCRASEAEAKPARIHAAPSEAGLAACK